MVCLRILPVQCAAAIFTKTVFVCSTRVSALDGVSWTASCCSLVTALAHTPSHRCICSRSRRATSSSICLLLPSPVAFIFKLILSNMSTMKHKPQPANGEAQKTMEQHQKSWMEWEARRIRAYKEGIEAEKLNKPAGRSSPAAEWILKRIAEVTPDAKTLRQAGEAMNNAIIESYCRESAFVSGLPQTELSSTVVAYDSDGNGYNVANDTYYDQQWAVNNAHMDASAARLGAIRGRLRALTKREKTIQTLKQQLAQATGYSVAAVQIMAGLYQRTSCPTPSYSAARRTEAGMHAYAYVDEATVGLSSLALEIVPTVSSIVVGLIPGQSKLRTFESRVVELRGAEPPAPQSQVRSVQSFNQTTSFRRATSLETQATRSALHGQWVCKHARSTDVINLWAFKVNYGAREWNLCNEDEPKLIGSVSTTISNEDLQEYAFAQATAAGITPTARSDVFVILCATPIVAKKTLVT